ncbi:hypothetical protein RND81_02G008700 [Saponaria officinalis]|uniref:Pectinesterase inhibitor domain-containing protein n=1 Tax=Saponaria officinalis TaxID=3572 RepID=A0AAW1MSE5_SAPOF
MSSFKCTIIIVIISLSIFSPFVNSDNDQQIDKLCGATFAPTVCASCIKSKIGPNITDVNIIASMLQCADDDANKLYYDTRKIVDDILTDDTVRYALQFCRALFNNVLMNGGKLRQLISDGKIDDAKSSIDGFIFQKLEQCNQIIKQYGITIPPKVFSGMFTVESDYKISFQLMSSVHV